MKKRERRRKECKGHPPRIIIINSNTHFLDSSVRFILRELNRQQQQQQLINTYTHIRNKEVSIKQTQILKRLCCFEVGYSYNNTNNINE